MVFAYYKRLTASQKRAYDKNDGVTSVRITNASELHPLVNALETTLKKEERKDFTSASQAFSISFRINNKIEPLYYTTITLKQI